jgi:hypothetical protein
MFANLNLDSRNFWIKFRVLQSCPLKGHPLAYKLLCLVWLQCRLRAIGF